MEKEYTPERVRMTMQTLRPLYDIVRLVDPEECRVIIIDDDNQIHTGEACHSVWNSHNRCSNCTSLKAVRTFSTVERTENYHGRKFQIHSTPIMLSLPDDVHLELFTDNRMYFTPRFDMGHLPVRYVALYEKGKGISRYGEVVSWRRAARGTLPGGGLSHGAHKRLLKRNRTMYLRF